MHNHTSGYGLTIKANNIIISYDDMGEGDIPVLFLHGYPFDRTMWRAQVESLQMTYRVIAIDIRGYGKSTVDDARPGMSLFADDLIALMDALQIREAVICGLSMGGFIALNALQRFPERFTTAILCDTQCIADSAQTKAKRQETIAQIEQDGKDKFCETFLNSVFHPESLKSKKDIVEKLREVVFANSQKTIISGLNALAEREDVCASLGDIKIPVLIICGRADGVTPLSESEFMQRNINGSVLQVLEMAGHVSNLEQPEAFTMILQDFLRPIGPTA